MSDSSVRLKLSWDSSLGWSDLLDKKGQSIYIQNDSYFRIKDFLTRREKGSLILSGERGAGKTTTLMNVIKGVDSNLIPIYVNALHLESTKNEKFLNTAEIIKELIFQFSREIERRNYHVSKKLKKLLKIINVTTFLKRESKTSELGVGVSGGVSLSTSNLIDGVIGLKSVFGKKIIEDELYLKFGYSVNDYAQDFSDVIEEFENNSKIKKILNLKIPIDSGLILIDVKKNDKTVKNKLKTVFIIDELDYYDQEKTNEIEIGFIQVLDALKKLKNLLALSGAHFIFITGQNTYKYAIDPENKYNTLFSEHTYVQKPEGEELIRYLDEILLENEKLEKVEILKWILIEESNHNYFLLNQAIKSRQISENNILKIELKFNEEDEKIALIHFAMNTIYSHFMKIGIFDQYSDELFRELSSIKDNFDKWIHAEGGSAISLTVDPAILPESKIRNDIRKAKRSFIRYLFIVNNIEIPPELQNEEAKEITPLWDSIKPQINLHSLKKGILGPVTDDEIEFFKLTKEILADVNKKLIAAGVPTVGTIESGLMVLSSSLSFATDPNDTANVLETIKSINEKPFFDRDPKITRISLDFLKNLNESLKTRLIIFKKNLFKVESGQVKLQGDKLILKDNARIILIRKKELSDFRASLKVTFPSEGLLNLLALLDLSTPPEDKFLMFRLDTRGPNEHQGNGVLLKDKNTSWDYIDKLGSSRVSAPIGKKIIASITFQNNNASLLLGSTNFSAYTDNSDAIKEIGFLLEIGEAEINDFKIDNVAHKI